MPRLGFVLCLVVSAIGLAACSNTTSDMRYTAPGTVARAAAPAISGVTAIDQRKEEAHRLATIMGGFGNPLKTLDLAKPVKDEVADAFTDGLRARGLLTAGAPYRIELLIRKYDADMLMGSTGRIDLDMTVIDSASQQTIYKDSAQNERSDFHFFATGVFASMDELQKLAQEALDVTVDQMLDKPAFRTAIGQHTVQVR
ncbi:MAG TPA: hypothetical protein VG328_15680 [Stellaceae bacterium]|jgi:uncharacterized lipoprotein YajG|nr:hypothetical protein [Stellaceae bacterium]